MTALDVISLDDAKNQLVVDYNDDDVQITRLIKSAVAMIENYTGHYFYQRTKFYPIVSGVTSITDYPLYINSINDFYGVPVTNYKTWQGTMVTHIGECGWYYNRTNQLTINASIGHTDITAIPEPLIDACFKLITYFYENKDIYSATLPADVQLMVNEFRRNATI